VLLVWAGLAAMIALGLTTSSVGGLLTIVVGVDTALLAALIAISYWLVEKPAPIAVPDPVGTPA
jgi:hypothetical protein